MSPILSSPKSAYVDGPAGTSLVTTAETVVATDLGIETTPEGDTVILEGFCQLTTGAGTTAVQLRVRRDNLAGAVVGVLAQAAIAAATVGQVAIQVSDTPGERASQAYVLTAQQVAATGNATVQAASLQATY